MALWKLPNEILSFIFDEVDGLDLWALALTSKQINVVATPRLYSRIEWTWKWAWDPPDEDSGSDREEDPAPGTFAHLRNLRIPPILRLLRTVCSRPDLASHMRAWRLTTDGPSSHLYLRDYVAPPSIPVRDKRSVPIIVSTIDSFEFLPSQLRTCWLRAIRNGDMSALVTLLLMTLPSLQELCVSALLFRRVETCLNGLIRSIPAGHPWFGGEGILNNLETIDCLPNEGRLSWHAKAVYKPEQSLPFYLPKIKQLSIPIDNPFDDWIWLREVPPVAEHLTHLTVTSVRETHLLSMLKACPNLEVLDWRWLRNPPDPAPIPYIPPWPLQWHILDLDLLADALLSVKDTLRQLTLRGGVFLSPSTDSNLVRLSGSLARLCELDGLTRLEMPLLFLAASTTHELSEALPANLETLTLTDALWGRNDNVRTQYVAKSLRKQPWNLPHLGHVQLRLLDEEENSYRECGDQYLYLRRHAHAAGIEVHSLLPTTPPKDECVNLR